MTKLPTEGKSASDDACYLKFLKQYMPVYPHEYGTLQSDVQHLAKARKHSEKLLQKLKDKYGAENSPDNPPLPLFVAKPNSNIVFHAKFKAETLAILQSKLCVQASILDANKKRRVIDRVSPNQIIKASHKFCIPKNVDEEVTVHFIKKSNGDYRRIEDFGPIIRGAQLAAAKLLSLTYTPRSFQYSDLGSGQKIELALGLIKDQGYRFVAEIDIVKFYETYKLPQLVAALPLHPVVVEQIVVALGTHWVTPKGTPMKPLSPKARPGIPQGSSASNEVAKWSIAHLPMPDPFNAKIIHHGDNFFVFAKDQKSLEAVSETLRSAIPGCPGGPFVGKLRQSQNVEKHGLEMLGCWISMEGTTVEAVPCQMAEYKFNCRVAREYKACFEQLEIAHFSGSEAHRFDAVLDFLYLRSYLENWKAAYGFCDPLQMQAMTNEASDGVEFLQQKYSITQHEVDCAKKMLSPVQIDHES